MKPRNYLSLSEKLKLGNWLTENVEAIKTMPLGEVRDRVRRTLRMEIGSNSLVIIMKQLKVPYLVQGRGQKKTAKLAGTSDSPVIAMALLSIMRAIDSKLDPGVQQKLLELIHRDNPQEQDHEEAAEKPEVQKAGGSVSGSDAKSKSKDKAKGKEGGGRAAAQSNSGSSTTH